MADQLGVDHIRAHWARQAAVHGAGPSASWSDMWAIELEIREILARLRDGERMLDVGCGNGYSTVRFAAERRVAVRGIDYVPELIALARTRVAEVTERLRGRVEFDVADVTTLDDPPDTYDTVLTTRVLINLGDWSAQRAALQRLVACVKPGGCLLLSEATLQGWQNLNGFRREWGLAPIPMPPFNAYLDQERVIDALLPTCELSELVNFSSTYFVATRVLKPILAAAAGASPDLVARPDTHWNRFWASAPAFGDYGTQKLFVFRKRSSGSG
jgi:SAM-dependent methyltransferase